MYKKQSHFSFGVRGRAAFTVLELCFAIAIFSFFAVGSVLALVQFNRFANNSRYQTLALTAAEQRMDQIMTVPWSVLGTRPAILTTGTTTESNLPLNNDSFNSTSGLSSAFTTLDTQVLDPRTTVISAVTGNTRLLSVTVTVNYTYRGRAYSIAINSMRATDDF
jgi:type II secretory pathway pseudopilin PulG